jgi:hypothetical protein
MGESERRGGGWWGEVSPADYDVLRGHEECAILPQNEIRVTTLSYHELINCHPTRGMVAERLATELVCLVS